MKPAAPLNVPRLIPESIRPLLRRGKDLPPQAYAVAAFRPATLAKVPYDPNATWRPRAWVLGLPRLRRESDIALWLPTAKKGDEAVYHVGESLAAARLDKAWLDRLARALLCRSDGEWPIITSCGHQRGYIIGSADVQLLQAKAGRHWLYLARRR